ncbi:hypothetical protein RJ639_037111 [Escallonia herrerae]|uniref:Protein odr-4 homolog n=1 Tax=Escallonia herrerae TaxID=1293975 RepID=A0AA89B8B7_9ASTE|nr:hypothetical protein RJ639_037111 [Escallonia herrerae]
MVGLVIGKLSLKLDRGFVFDLVPTPPNDDGQPACSVTEGDKKRAPNKGKSQAQPLSLLFVDTDWVAEHARQVSRLLLGGMKVVGIYIWVNESTFKNSTIALCQTVKGAAEAAPLLEVCLDERLLIHISYSPRRWTCRNCMLPSNISSNSLRPCDFKMGRVLTSLQTFKCTYSFDVRYSGESVPRLPICSENASSTRRLIDILRRGISSHAKELKDAKALIDGMLVIIDDRCLSDGSHEVEFLLPLLQDTSMEACSNKEAGVLVFKGSVCSLAYLNSKEPLSQALTDIKGDIITSLMSRLDIICDEAERELDTISTGGVEASYDISTAKPILQHDLQLLRKQCGLSFPRRVFVPWLAGTCICDYIQPSETLEVLKDHCVELMSMEAPTDASTILEPETEATTLVVGKSFWDMAVPFFSEFTLPKSRDETSLVGDKNSVKSTDFNIMAALLILMLSIVVGLVLLVRAS